MTDVYATRAQLATALGGTIGDNTRADVALIAATRWVDYRVGIADPADEPDLTIGSVSITATTCPAAYHMACLAVAVRFYQSPTVPFGFQGVGEFTAFVKSSIPEAEILLMGHRQTFGIA